MQRKSRKVFKGTVISDKMDKAVVVKVETLKMHTKFKKYYKVSKKYYVKDENNECKPGDLIEIMETRPISRLIRWRLVKVLKKAVV